MSLVTIRSSRSPKKPEPFFSNGMKPFFLGAAAYAVVSMGMWAFMYTLHHGPDVAPIAPFQWHAHEMVYGFTLAVIAGFLFAAIPEWTNVPTVGGEKLKALFVLWVVARLLALGGASLKIPCAVADVAFSLKLCVAVAHPIFSSKDWRQAGILTKVSLFAAGNIFFYLGVFGVFSGGATLSVYGGLYLVLSLMLTIGGRVMPAFVENGVGYSVSISVPRWITFVSMALFLIFFVADLISPGGARSGGLSLILGIFTLIRLYFWHTSGIWRKPLLWGLYASFISVALGFFLLSASSFGLGSRYIAIHAWTVGGIGLATLSMMMRAALGHSGGDVRNPPREFSYALWCLIGALVARVAFPALWPQHYGAFIAISQVLWICAYGILVWLLARIFFPQLKTAT